MNTVKVRDRLARFVESEVIDANMAKVMLTAPLFLQTRTAELNDTEIEWCKQNIMDASCMLPKLMPYRTFVVHLQEESDTYCWQFDDALVLVMAIPTGEKEDEYWIWVVFKYQENPNDAGLMTGYFNGKQIPDRKGISEDNLNLLANTPRHHVVTLCYEVMCPANTVLRVEPNKPAKSVQWRESRTHYLILARKQAERCQLGNRGPNGHEIERAAHFRRAHLRRLMSEKFTFKRGQLVFVRHAWVGPLEWIGNDGKIYKVQLPAVDNSPGLANSHPLTGSDR